MPKVKTFNQKFCKTFTQKKKNHNKSRCGFPTETIIPIFNFAMHQETIQINSCRYFCKWYQNLRNTSSTYEKWVLRRPGQAEYVATLQEVTGMDKCSQNRRKCLRSSEIKKYEIRVQRVKEILTEEP